MRGNEKQDQDALEDTFPVAQLALPMRTQLGKDVVVLLHDVQRARLLSGIGTNAIRRIGGVIFCS